MLAQRILCCLCTCQTLPGPSPAHALLAPEISRMGMIQGTDTVSCAAKFNAWAIQQHFGKGSGWHQTSLTAKNVNTAMTAAKSQHAGSEAEVHHHLKTAQSYLASNLILAPSILLSQTFNSSLLSTHGIFLP